MRAGTGSSSGYRSGVAGNYPCTTINKVCGSSLKAAMIAATEIRAGVSEVVIVGGMESMTNAPHIARNVAKGQDVPFGSLESVLIGDGLKDAFTGESMGNTGETVAEEHGITREESDKFAVRSHPWPTKRGRRDGLAKRFFLSVLYLLTKEFVQRRMKRFYHHSGLFSQKTVKSPQETPVKSRMEPLQY